MRFKRQLFFRMSVAFLAAGVLSGIVHSRQVSLVSRAAAQGTVKPGPTGAAGVRLLTEHLKSVREKYGLPAMAAVVLVDGKPVAFAAVGERKLGSRVRVTQRDLFHLGSCTKAMTALLIEQLVDEGHFKRRDRIADLSPRLAARMHEELAELTLDHCLAHRGGFVPSEQTFEDIPDSSMRLTGKRARFDYASRMLSRKPLSAPGTKYVYSNVGHTVAAVVAEEKMKTSWELLMTQHIFRPLKMTTVGYGAPGSADKVDQPWPHKYEDETQKPVPPGPGADNAELIGPAARVHCSMADWAKFAAVFLTDGHEDPAHPALLSNEARGRLLTPPFGTRSFGYAGGWRVGRSPVYGRTLSHDGSNTLNFCHAWLLPDSRFGVLVATNSGIATAKRACDQVQGLATKDWHNGGRTYSELVAENRRALYVRQWLKRMQTSQIQVAKNFLTPELFDFLTSEDGQKLCGTLKDLGPPTKLEFVERKTGGKAEYSVYRVTFKARVWRFEFETDKKNRVTWLKARTPFTASAKQER